MKELKELLKDWVVLSYIVIAIASAVYLAYALLSAKVVVISSPILPNGSTIYSIKYLNGQTCEISQPSDFYSCIKNETLTILTSSGPIVIPANKTNLLFKTKVTEESLIKLGIDLAGGTRVILKPAQNITLQELQLAASVIEKRLNSYGLKSIDIRVSQDMEGHGYIIIDLPSSEENLIDIIKKQGKFEAKIGNVTVFTGQDIKTVHTYAPEGGIQSCWKVKNGEWACKFYFTVYVSPEAARRFANATKNLSVVLKNGEAYLSKPLTLYIDNKKVDELLIAASLKGEAVERAMVSGLGYGYTRQQAIENAMKNMKDLATILSYGSLPTTFKVVRTERIPPTIGEFILSSVFAAGLIAFLSVCALVYLAYRRFKPALLIIINMVIEIIITVALGVALGQTFDLPAIAGVLIAIGTGVDDQIIAIEEVLRGKKDLKVDKKVWKVLFIVMSSFLVMLFAMSPLIFAGLGLLRGFAIMTIIGAFIGAFLTRPAFVRMAQRLL